MDGVPSCSAETSLVGYRPTEPLTPPGVLTYTTHLECPGLLLSDFNCHFVSWNFSYRLVRSSTSRSRTPNTTFYRWLVGPFSEMSQDYWRRGLDDFVIPLYGSVLLSVVTDHLLVPEPSVSSTYTPGRVGERPTHCLLFIKCKMSDV